MGMYEEIKAQALDVAQHVTDDPAKRDMLANDLIELVGMMTRVVADNVAQGETVGDRMLRVTTEVVEESMVATVPTWNPRCRKCDSREFHGLGGCP